MPSYLNYNLNWYTLYKIKLNFILIAIIFIVFLLQDAERKISTWFLFKYFFYISKCLFFQILIWHLTFICCKIIVYRIQNFIEFHFFLSELFVFLWLSLYIFLFYNLSKHSSIHLSQEYRFQIFNIFILFIICYKNSRTQTPTF